MGITMGEYCRAGALVWVQTKNGSWWPGTVMPHHLTTHNTTIPVQLLGPHTAATLDWYNLDDSKRIKSFRCSEFKHWIKSAELPDVLTSFRNTRYANRANAILHALELEKKQLCEKRKMPERTLEEDQIGAICRSKRNRCVYLPSGSNNCLERTSFHTQPFPRLNGDSHESSASEENPSSRFSETHSSKSSTHSLKSSTDNGEINEAIRQLSGTCDKKPGKRNYKDHFGPSYRSNCPTDEGTAENVEVKKWKVKKKLKSCCLKKSYGLVPYQQSYISSRNGRHAKGDPSTLDAASKYHIRTGNNNTALEYLTGSIYSPSIPAPQDCTLGNPGRRTRSASSLVDVKLTIQPNCRAEHVPLISLLSRLSGKAIIGHPVEIEDLDDGSTDICPPKSEYSGLQVLDNIGSDAFPSVWRKARRTPVCYIPSPSSISDHEFAKPAEVCREESPVKEKENSSFAKQELLKPLKKCILSNPNTTEFSVSTQQIYGGCSGDRAGKKCKLNWQLNDEETEPARATCVPVKLITSKLLTAFGLQPEADN